MNNDTPVFYLSFAWGGCRYTRANNLTDAQREAAQAAEALDCSVNLLDNGLHVLGTATARDGFVTV